MPTDFFVRVASIKDETSVNDVLMASYARLMQSHYDGTTLAAALPLMTQANSALLTSGKYYVAETPNGQVMGCGGWSLERPGSGEVERELAHVRHFATHADRIGHGIGRAIYLQCEKEARQAGARRLECYSSLNAEGFYAALGFVSIRKIYLPMGPNLTLPSILMERSI